MDDSPVGGVVAVELGQRHLLQLNLQLLVLPLQVHDHAVEEVDLDTKGTEVKSSNVRCLWCLMFIISPITVSPNAGGRQ